LQQARKFHIAAIFISNDSTKILFANKFDGNVHVCTNGTNCPAKKLRSDAHERIHNF
jgi:hypothetical protein